MKYGIFVQFDPDSAATLASLLSPIEEDRWDRYGMGSQARRQVPGRILNGGPLRQPSNDQREDLLN